MSVSASRKLKILQLCHDYKGPFPLICRQYCDAFSNADVTTIYLKGKNNSTITERTGGDKVIYLHSSSRSLRGVKFSLLFRLFAFFYRANFDIVIAHRYKPIYLAGVISFFYRSLLILGVVHEHNVFHRFNRASFLKFWGRGIHLIAVSRSVANNIAQGIPSIARDRRIHVLGHALSEDAKLLSREAAREMFGISSDYFIFGAVGRLIEKKRFDLLLIAFAAAEFDDNCVLVILGDGPQASSLTDLAKSLGILHQVFFVGHLDRAAQYYKAFDCFVMPSSEAEAFGVVLLEAMFAKLPIIASEAPGLDDVLCNVGIRFSGREELTKNLQGLYRLSSDQRSKLGFAARERLDQEFFIESFSKKLKQLPPMLAFSKVDFSP